MSTLRTLVGAGDRDRFTSVTEDFRHDAFFHESRLANRFAAGGAGDTLSMNELSEPTKALREAGARIDIISQKRDPIQAFKHHQPTIKVDVDATLDEARPDQYDALRSDPKVQNFVKAIDAENKPMAVICHAPRVARSGSIARSSWTATW